MTGTMTGGGGGMTGGGGGGGGMTPAMTGQNVGRDRREEVGQIKRID